MAAAVAAVALIALPAGADGAPTAAHRQRTFTGTFGSFPDYMDPALSYTQEGWTAMYDVYVPLLTYRHADGAAGSEVIPGLAEDLPEISDDGHTYTLFLRRGLRYSDGTPVRASDFRWAVERMLLMHSGGTPFYTDVVGARQFLRKRRGGIRGILANDETGRIVIHLVEPRSTFTNELALLFAAPVPRSTPAHDSSFHPPPATGPYAMTHVSIDGWTYVRNPEWKRNAGQLPQLPSGQLGRIVIEVVRDRDEQIQGVERGRFDWMENPPPLDRYAAVRSRYEGTQFRVEPSLNVYYFWMNTRKAPFNDLRVRQAVNYAIDPAVLERIYAGGISSTQQILPPGMPGYQQFVLYPHDLARARQLIAKAHPADREITVWGDREAENLEATAYYAAVLRQLGFRIHLKLLNPDNYFFVIGNTRTPNLDTGWSDWYEDYPHPNDFFQPLLSSRSILPTNNGNFAQIADPPLDQQIAELQATPGPIPVERYAALDRSFMEKAPWAPFGNRTLTTFVSKSVDLESVIYNPTFGPDLTSFRFK